jgi:hypothetical protein
VRQRIIAGDPWRKTRLHDIRGNFIGARALLTDLPRSFVGAVLRETIGYRRGLPWIPYPAIRVLNRLAQPDWHVLESGAGMSTIWWAQRVGHVHAIEVSETWCALIERELRTRGLTNVVLEHRTATFSDLSMFPGIRAAHDRCVGAT